MGRLKDIKLEGVSMTLGSLELLVDMTMVFSDGRKYGMSFHFASFHLFLSFIHRSIYLSISLTIYLCIAQLMFHSIIVSISLGLVGRNGIGKTTFLKHLVNKIFPGIPGHLQILHIEQEVHASDDSVSSITQQHASIVIIQYFLKYTDAIALSGYVYMYIGVENCSVYGY